MLHEQRLLEPDANLEEVRKLFRAHTDFGGVFFKDVLDVSLASLYQEQNLQKHAESRAQNIFATGSTRAPQLVLDHAGKDSLHFLYQSMLVWSRAREVHVMPLVKTNVVTDAQCSHGYSHVSTPGTSTSGTP